MKIIAIFKEHEDLDVFKKKSDEKFKAILERVDFVTKQMGKLEKDSLEEKRDYWDKTEAFLKKEGLLPKEYNEDTHVLSSEEDCICMHTKQERKSAAISKIIGFTD